MAALTPARAASTSRPPIRAGRRRKSRVALGVKRNPPGRGLRSSGAARPATASSFSDSSVGRAPPGERPVAFCGRRLYEGHNSAVSGDHALVARLLSQPRQTRSMTRACPSRTPRVSRLARRRGWCLRWLWPASVKY